MDLVGGVISRMRAAGLRMRGVTIEGKCWLRSVEIPRQHSAIKLESGVALDRGVVLLVSGETTTNFKISIGRQTYINRHTMIDASEQISIGSGCMIGPFCYLTDHDHQFGVNNDLGSSPLVSRPTRLEDRVWLGAHVTVLKGVTIGAASVIGAGSVVTKSIPPNAVAVGNPARVIRKTDE